MIATANGTWLTSSCFDRRDRQREHQLGRGVIGDQFGQHHRQEINHRQLHPRTRAGPGDHLHRQHLRQSGRLQRLGDAGRCADGHQHRPVDALPRLVAGAAAGDDHRDGGDERRGEHVPSQERHDADHRQQNGERRPGPIMPGGCRIRHIADQVEIVGIPLLIGEIGMGFQKQRVAGLQHDVADLAGQSLPAARHGQHGRLITRSKLPFADRLVQDRAAVRNHRFDQRPVRDRRSPI